MFARKAALVVGAVALMTAFDARADTKFDLEGYFGWGKVDVGGGSVSGVTDSNMLVGGAFLVKAGWFGIGVSLDKGLDSNIGAWSGSALVGALIDISPSFRLDALGMAGRTAMSVGDMFSSTGATYLGIRPGFSFLVAGPVRLGVSVPIRWTNYSFGWGSAEYSVIGRVIFEF